MAVAPPVEGLGSNFNYFLGAGGDAITGLNVEITFAEPLISTANGFGFQLNAYAQELENAPSTTPTWQQYIVLSTPDNHTLYSFIDNWSGTAPSRIMEQIINDVEPITTLPEANVIPAGATINITPIFNSKNVLTGITYTYTPPSGQVVSTTTILTDLDVYYETYKVTAAYESPIAALTLNIVADWDGNNAVFTSGSGTIVYTANQPLTVTNSEPMYTSFQDGTGETANTAYGELPISNSTKITQTWWTVPNSPQEDRKVVGHKLPISRPSRHE